MSKPQRNNAEATESATVKPAVAPKVPKPLKPRTVRPVEPRDPQEKKLPSGNTRIDY